MYNILYNKFDGIEKKKSGMWKIYERKDGRGKPFPQEMSFSVSYGINSKIFYTVQRGEQESKDIGIYPWDSGHIKNQLLDFNFWSRN